MQNQSNLPNPLDTPELPADTGHTLPSDTGHSLPEDTLTQEEHEKALPVVQDESTQEQQPE